MRFRAACAGSRPSRSARACMAQQPAPQPRAAGGGGRGAQPAPPAPPLRVLIYAGLKTHAAGQHDYPQFLADWSKILTERGAYVTGGLQFPSARELSSADVMVIYKGDAGYLGAEDRAALDSFMRRGGGIVSIHDALCGPEPEHFAGIVGGAKKHGEMNYTLEADVPYTIVDTAQPDHAGDDQFTIKDEAFFHMTWSKTPEIKVLATATMAPRRARRGTKAKSCRRSGPTRSRWPRRRPACPIARSSGCRGTTTRTSRCRTSRRCCCAALRGRASARLDELDDRQAAARPRRTWHESRGRRRLEGAASNSGQICLHFVLALTLLTP